MTDYVIIIAFALGLALGVYLEHEFNLAREVVAAFQQTQDAQQGEVKLIKDTQTINKDIANDKKDPCLGTPVPVDLNRVLH